MLTVGRQPETGRIISRVFYSWNRVYNLKQFIYQTFRRMSFHITAAGYQFVTRNN